MRAILQRKAFGIILVVLLFGACVYPPFYLITESEMKVGRKWNWIFTLLPTPSRVPEIDLEMLFFEAITAVLLAIGISLILFGFKTLLKQRRGSEGKVAKPSKLVPPIRAGGIAIKLKDASSGK